MATEKKTASKPVQTSTIEKTPAVQNTAKAKVTAKADKVVAKADEAVKEAVKTVKTAAKKTTTKKAPAKKAAKPVTVNTHIQFGGKDLSEENIVTAIKADWRAHGNKLADVKTIDIYIKPEDGKAYYVINDSFAESIEL